MRLRIACLFGFAYAVQSPIQAQSGDLFSGPSILSRGAKPIGFSNGRPVRFTFYASTGVTYSTGLIAAFVDQNGHLSDDSSYGGYLNVGMYGNRSMHRGSFGFNYQASYQLFAKESRYSGVNQSLGLNYTRQLSRRSSFSLGVGAGQNHTNFGLTRADFTTNYADIPIDPSSELFDSPNYFLSVSGGLNYQLSSRVTVSAVGSTFATRRKSAALVNSNGWNGGGQISYALSRKSSIGGGVHYGNYYFQRAFGESQFVTASVFYSRALTRRWNLSASGGAYRVHAQRILPIRVDPVIAALIGQSYTYEAGTTDQSGFQGSVSASTSYRRSTISITYIRGVVPGNGLYLTSTGDSVHAGLVYQGFRKAGLFANASAGRMKEVLETSNRLPANAYESATGGVSYRLASYISLTASVGVGRYDIGAFAGHTRAYASAGLSFSPAQIPLVLW